MNSRPFAQSSRIAIHGHGIGPLTPEDFEHRAREIAWIEDRHLVTEDDRTRARAELSNEDLPPTISEDELETMQSLSRDPSDPASSRGHQTPEYGVQDGQQDIERLAVQGVEEAQHEQMLEARRREEKELRRGR